MQVLAVQPVMDKRASITLEFLLETLLGPCADLHSRGIAVSFLNFSKASLLEVLLQPQLASRSSVRLLTVQTRLWGSAEGVVNLNQTSLQAKVWSHAVI